MTANRKILLLAIAGGAGLLVLVTVLFWGQTPAPPPPPTDEMHFRDVAKASGLNFWMRFLTSEQGETFKVNLYDHGSGIAVADFNGDGYDDIYFVNQLGENALFRNKGDGTFEDVTKAAGVGLGDRICTAAVFNDFDNDGHPDLFVTSTRGGNVLFRNQGDGTFKDVTKEAGVAHTGHSQAGFFFDFDGDGFLDLLLLQTAAWTSDPVASAAHQYFPGKGNLPGGLADVASSPKEYNILYKNVADGRGGRKFVDVTEGSGLRGQGWSADAAIVDYDDDGRPDVLITCMFGPSQLYHNAGGGKFTDVTQQALGRTSAGGMGARAFDSRNSGRLDLYIVDMHSDMWTPSTYDLSKVEETKKYQYMFITDAMAANPGARAFEKKVTDLINLPYQAVLFGNTFHRNKGNGVFEEASGPANLETFWPWGIATGDFDGDGFEDIYIPSGMGYPWGYWPNRLMMNNGDGTFTERSREEGVEPPAKGTELDEFVQGKPLIRSSRAAAVADFDGDGRLDIVVNNFNDAPYYFRNNSPRKNYMAFRLQGTRSNRDAIGAVVRVHVGGQVMTRQVSTAGGYLSQSSRTVHFGLGDRSTVDKVEIRWPSGTIQVLDRPTINTRQDIVEPAN